MVLIDVRVFWRTFERQDLPFVTFSSAGQVFVCNRISEIYSKRRSPAQGWTIDFINFFTKFVFREYSLVIWTETRPDDTWVTDIIVCSQNRILESSNPVWSKLFHIVIAELFHLDWRLHTNFVSYPINPDIDMFQYSRSSKNIIFSKLSWSLRMLPQNAAEIFLCARRN